MKFNVNVSDKENDINSSYTVDVKINNMIQSEKTDVDKDSEILEKEVEIENQERTPELSTDKKNHKEKIFNVSNVVITILISLLALDVSVRSLHVARESLNVAGESLNVSKESLDVSKEALDAAKVGAWAGVESLGYIEFFYENGIETYSEYREILKYEEDSEEAVGLWLEDIDKIRIGCSCQYIKNILGEPINVEELEFYGLEYSKELYINPFCTIMCIYDQNPSLIGYMIIGNDVSLKAKSYRAGFSLFDYTINEAEQFCLDNGIGPVVFCNSLSTGRLDCNTYYFQCSYQHSKYATPAYYIGYGICDIGAIDSYDEYDKAKQEMTSATRYDDSKTYYKASKYDSIRDIPINVIFVLRDMTNIDEFIEQYIASNCLCLSVDDFANFQNDYTAYIKKYNDRKYGEQYREKSAEEESTEEE